MSDAAKTIWSTNKLVDKFDVSDAELRQLEGDPSHAMFAGLVAAHIGETDRLLDVGCAVGSLYGLLKLRGIASDYTGVDLTPEFIERARLRYPEKTFDVASILELPFTDAEFDAVVSKGTVFVTDDWRKAVGEVIRVTRRLAVFNLILHEPGRDSELVAPPDRGPIFLLGDDGQKELTELLAPHEFYFNRMSRGLHNRNGLHPAYAAMSSITHLFVTVFKSES